LPHFWRSQAIDLALDALALWASQATWNPQLEEPKGRMSFRIPVSPPFY
jgi:hypothetical protein